ncbi:MAG: FecR domain-containing protein [Saprospiraceae bacterium]|nr:FecR domain-containing protein [Saprospiraceae bacterium]
MATEKYLHLVFKRLAEGLTTAEAKQLQAWLEASAENQRAAAEIEAIFKASGQDVPPVDIPTELNALKNRLRVEAAPTTEFAVTHRNPKRLWWAAAAALVVLLAAVFVFRQAGTLASEWETVASGPQQNQRVNLPDGSRVWLNSDSEISYVKNVDEQPERQVRLTGEAFFEVAKDPTKPFDVETDGCQVRVLGTSFNVRARASEPTVEVALRTGRVQISTKSEIAELWPGQQAVVAKNTRKMEISTPGDTHIAEWRTSEMTFQNLPLAAVVERLSRRFEQNIVLGNAALSDCRYSGYFPKADLVGILANLEAVFGVNIERKAGSIRLEGGQCPR